MKSINPVSVYLVQIFIATTGHSFLGFFFTFLFQAYVWNLTQYWDTSHIFTLLWSLGFIVDLAVLMLCFSSFYIYIKKENKVREVFKCRHPDGSSHRVMPSVIQNCICEDGRLCSQVRSYLSYLCVYLFIYLFMWMTVLVITFIVGFDKPRLWPDCFFGCPRLSVFFIGLAYGKCCI